MAKTGMTTPYVEHETPLVMARQLRDSRRISP